MDINNYISQPFSSKNTSSGTEYFIAYYCQTKAIHDEIKAVNEIDSLAVWVPTEYAEKAIVSNVQIERICPGVDYPCIIEVSALKVDETTTRTTQQISFIGKKIENYSVSEFSFDQSHFSYVSLESVYLVRDDAPFSIIGQTIDLVTYNSSRISRFFSTSTTSTDGLYSPALIDYLINTGVPRKCRCYECEVYLPESEFENASILTNYCLIPSSATDPRRWRLESMNVTLVSNCDGKLLTKLVKSYIETPFSYIIWKNLI